MAKRHLLLAALLAAGMAQAADQTEISHATKDQATVVRNYDEDGFTQPLKSLKFNPGLDQREFERASTNALEVFDPLESWNRRVWHFNYRFDEWVFLPVVDGYRYITPGFVRSGVSNFFSNLGDVPNLLNSMLQFKGQRSLQTTGRLLLNTTIGVAGLWDPATMMGLPKQSEDFGQTLGFYGVPAGPYIVLPLFGPSNLRDTGGLIFDVAAESQINFLNVAQVSSDHPEILILRGIDKRYVTSFRYGQMNSPFEYEKVRYVYSESRKLMIAE
ncbi:VacJ family lipoprotein [Pseudomonas sp. 21LCFQ010]|uniref:MlaA family lipoprotein n=1 Tax=Pseudomonas sp. 21LCFQ010 TaxID=2957506 RepID=UPI0020971482|nr:VacJ family lipoprotein [Pseudomonas sp. 21LCFQ010]